MKDQKKFEKFNNKTIGKNIIFLKLFFCLILLCTLIIPFVFAIALPPPPASPNMGDGDAIDKNINTPLSSLKENSFNYLPYIIFIVAVFLFIFIYIRLNKRFIKPKDMNNLNRGKQNK